MTLYINDATLDSKIRSNTVTLASSFILFNSSTVLCKESEFFNSSTIRSKKSEFTTANGASCSKANVTGCA